MESSKNEWVQDGYLISTDKALIDLELVHHFLSRDSYWAAEIPFAIVKKSIDHSLCFGIYRDGAQVGFARVVSDYATFAYLADVFILPPHRGRGLSKYLMKVIMDFPELQGLRRFLLTTVDAHSLYAQFGFEIYPQPERMMGRNFPDLYKINKRTQ